MIGTKYDNFVQDFPYIIPTKYQFIVPPSFRRKDFSNYSQSETRIAHVDHDFCLIGMKSYRRSSTDASYQISKELPIVTILVV